MPASVLIVDDHEAIRRGLRCAFRRYPEFSVCGEAVDGADALKKAQELDDTEHRMIPFIEKYKSIKEAVATFGRI